MPDFPKTVTAPILRRKEIAGKAHAFVVCLNADRKVDGLVFHPDKSTNGAWDLLEAGDELTCIIRGEAEKHPGTYVGKAADFDDQPNKLKTAIRNRKRGEAGLHRSDIMLPPRYAEALQRACRAAGDPDTATWASRLVIAHLTPFLGEGSSNG